MPTKAPESLVEAIREVDWSLKMVVDYGPNRKGTPKRINKLLDKRLDLMRQRDTKHHAVHSSDA